MFLPTISKNTRLLNAIAILALSSCASGPIGRPDANAMSWEFIQSVGGVHLGILYTIDSRQLVTLVGM